MVTTVSNLLSRLPHLDDRHAWEQFEQRYTPVLRRYFRQSGCGDEVARDLTQDTLERVALGLRRGAFRKDRGRLRDWIGGIARNVLRNYRRKAAPRTNADELKTQFWESHEDEAAENQLLAADRRFDAIWVRQRLSSLIRVAAQSFDLRELRCYFLVEVRKLPIKEVARRTRLSESAVFMKRRNVANWMLQVGPRFISRWES
ncbi:MAG: sigma-70 family RNA polymerase sigma factor [Phycisphaerales bacterium]|nr:sigma-70 family RNA polymerase sigma factor [Phycisphaerales bacterium]